MLLASFSLRSEWEGCTLEEYQIGYGCFIPLKIKRFLIWVFLNLPLHNNQINSINTMFLNKLIRNHLKFFLRQISNFTSSSFNYPGLSSALRWFRGFLSLKIKSKSLKSFWECCIKISVHSKSFNTKLRFCGQISPWQLGISENSCSEKDNISGWFSKDCCVGKG